MFHISLSGIMHSYSQLSMLCISFVIFCQYQYHSLVWPMSINYPDCAFVLVANGGELRI